MKKLLSLIVAAVLAISAVPVMACADSGYVDPDKAYQAAIAAYEKSLKSYIYKVYDMQDDGVWDSSKKATEKEPNNFRFSCTGPYTGFDLFIDGEKIPWDEYTSWPITGGTTFEIDNDYMAELKTGEHRISCWFIDGYRGAGYFEVK